MTPQLRVDQVEQLDQAVNLVPAGRSGAGACEIIIIAAVPSAARAHRAV